MVDKLDLEVPQGKRFRPAFARAWNNPEMDSVFKKTTGGLYLVTADLRDVGIPARLSCGHKHHEKLGPKLEIIGAGEMAFSQWAEVHEEIFEGEAWDDAILRADLTADVRGVPVSDFGRAMWCKFKHTTQQEYGEFQHMTTSHSRFAAQTLYYGRKPRQMRFYDKTRHRLQVLLPALHRKQKREGQELSTFAEVYGYEPDVIVTRAERQMGARETAEAWGVGCLGELPRLMKCDPFERLKFTDDAAGGRRMEDLEVPTRGMILYLRELIERGGIDQARAWLRGEYGTRARAFRKFWAENEHLIVRVNPRVSREFLTQEFRRTLAEQLAA